MDTKLTLRLDSKIIEKAKAYAKKNNVSLSRIIESYLDSVTGKESTKSEITPLVKSLGGVIRVDQDTDIKKDYTDYLAQKYQ